MRVTVNGEPRDVPEGATVGDVLGLLGVPAGAAAATEVNKTVIPRAERAATRLKDGDRLEIVTLVGGG